MYDCRLTSVHSTCTCTWFMQSHKNQKIKIVSDYKYISNIQSYRTLYEVWHEFINT